MADYGLWSGLERATGNMATTGMGLLKMQQDRLAQEEKMGIARDQMKIAQEAAAREKTAFEHAERKRLEQEAQENAFVAVSSIAPKIHETPKLKSMMLETVKSAGFEAKEMPDGEIYLPMKGINFVKNLIGTQADFQKKALDATLADLSDRSVSISQKIAELQESGKMDEKTLAPLIQQRDAIKTQIAGILTADVAFQKQMAIEKAKKTGSLPTEASLAASAAAGDQTAGKALDLLRRQKEKEVNVANEVDTILGGMFPGYFTDPEARRKALDYYSTPEGSRDVQNRVAEFVRKKTPPQFYPVQTTEGIAPFQAKGPGAGSVGTPTGSAKPLPAEAAKSFGDLDALRTSIGQAEKLYKEKYVGPVAGRYYSIAENIQNLPEDQVRFYAYVNDAKDALLRARSGAQINEQEYARLVKFLPTPELPPENFKARSKRFLEQVNIIMRDKKKAYEGQGYRVNFDNEPGKPSMSYPGASPGRVRVKSPNGSIGTIPVGQLNDALSQGYKRVD